MTRLLLKVSGFLLVIQLFSFPSFSQRDTKPGGWEGKAISDWNQSDVNDILRESEWSRIVTGKSSLSNPLIGTVVVDSKILFTLRSSLVLRYAIVRSEQLKAKYDSMDNKAKAGFDAQMRPLLACADCDRFYIVSIVADSDLLGNAAGVQRRASKIFLLNDKGEKRELVRFSPKTTGSSEALFFFKRYDAKGMPLLSPRNTSFSFNFGVEPQDDDPIRIMERIEVRVPLIVRQNQVIF